MIRLFIRLSSLVYQAFLYGRSGSSRQVTGRVSDTNYPFY
jgi:hypothetical protein